MGVVMLDHEPLPFALWANADGNFQCDCGCHFYIKHPNAHRCICGRVYSLRIHLDWEEPTRLTGPSDDTLLRLSYE